MQLINTPAGPGKGGCDSALPPLGLCQEATAEAGGSSITPGWRTNRWSQHQCPQQISKQREMGVKMEAQRSEVVDPRSEQSCLPELEAQLSWVHPWSSADTQSNLAISERNAQFDSIILCTAVMVNLSWQISWSYMGYYFFTMLTLSSRNALQMLFMIHLRSMINKT